MTSSVPVLHVCTTCSAGETIAPGGEPPGQRLHDAVARLADRVTVRPVVCLASCDRGCTASIGQPGKWSYLVGDLRPDIAADLLAYADAYAASANGAVLRAGRPESLRHAIIARLPAPEFA